MSKPTDDIRVMDMRESIKRILEFVEGRQLRPGLRETPARYVEAFDFLTSGYRADDNPKHVLKCFEDGAEGVDEMIVQRDIPFYSLCEHHLLPFFGVAHIAYVPVKKIVGLSKMPRLVDIFARRLQVQERLCAQIAKAMDEGLRPRGVGVVLQARHMCMEMRGVQKPGTVTITSSLLGAIKNKPEARAEFMSLALQRGTI